MSQGDRKTFVEFWDSSYIHRSPKDILLEVIRDIIQYNKYDVPTALYIFMSGIHIRIIIEEFGEYPPHTIVYSATVEDPYTRPRELHLEL